MKRLSRFGNEKIKKNIAYSKNRVVLSDTLPFETPLTFSNRHFYNFLTQFNISYIDLGNGRSTIDWHLTNKEHIDSVIKHLVRILFDTTSFDRPVFLDKDQQSKIPFTYKITHKESDFRELSIPHLKSQLELVSFYEKYKELILYYSSISPFSLRKPFSIAKFTFSNDSLHKNKIGDDHDIIEDSDKEYENLKTFFTYKEYSNIYKFYEDFKYHRAEKKYNKLLKFDIAKCFDSIYTHSISWALYNKGIIKENLTNSKKTFSNKFDEFIQNSNYGETNGIIIGPEYSRIFSELILQQIDKRVENELRLDCKLLYKSDYEIYRYVDDYFVFYNSEDAKDKILLRYKHHLRDFKMAMSDSKTILYDKPLITELTIAKEKIVELFNEKIKFKVETVEDKIIEELKFKCNANHLITKFKIIVRESNVEYRNILNYTLAILNKKVERSVKKFEKHYEKLLQLEIDGRLDNSLIKTKIKHENQFTEYISGILDFSFFLYTVSPRVNSTIKLTSILSCIIKCYKSKFKIKSLTSSEIRMRFVLHNREIVFKKIFDEINLVLNNNKYQKHIQIETLYLFIVIRELGKDYRLTPSQLSNYFLLKDDNSFQFDLNYFSTTVLIFYVQNIKSYSYIKDCVLEQTLKRICSVEKTKRTQNTELVLLFLDLLVCPYISSKFKRKMMILFDIKDSDLQNNFLNFVNYRRYWFTKWDNFNLNKEILAKKSQEVY